MRTIFSPHQLTRSARCLAIPWAALFYTGLPLQAYAEDAAIRNRAAAGVKVAPGLLSSLGSAASSAFGDWSTAWDALLREHESATGEGLRIFLEIQPGTTADEGENIRARERWLEWKETGNSTQSQRCVGVATWTGAEVAVASQPRWSLFCGLAIDAALGDAARLSPYSSTAVRFRRRLDENLRIRDESHGGKGMESIPVPLLESADLISAHLLLLLNQLQSPLSLGPTALSERWEEAGTDGGRIPLWEDLSLAVRNSSSSAEFIGGDEEPPQDIPFSRWALGATLLAAFPLVMLLGAWIHSREVRWTRFGREKVSAARWSMNALEAIWIRWKHGRRREAGAGSLPHPPDGEMEVLHGKW